VPALGPYQFTDRDVSTTLASGWALFDQLEHRLDPAHVEVVEPYRLEAESILERVVAGEVAEIDGLSHFWTVWRDAMAALRRAGAYGPRAEGSVSGLWRSGGGVPKAPIDEAEVRWSGVQGDRQRDRKDHGRPFQALCIWSSEVIDGFRSEGHPIAPGVAGENVTVTGIRWDRVVPGVQMRLGQVLAEVSAYAIPCAKNKQWFNGGRFGLMHHRQGPVSRVYATVLEPGRIELGDPVVLEPSG
jgi:MOSC domain-containing protein YiiM